MDSVVKIMFGPAIITVTACNDGRIMSIRPRYDIIIKMTYNNLSFEKIMLPQNDHSFSDIELFWKYQTHQV